MPLLTPEQMSDLLDVLSELPTTKTVAQREALLFSLPAQITDSLDLSGDRTASLAKLVQDVEYWGQLPDGRWATEVVVRNALRTARNTKFESTRCCAASSAATCRTPARSWPTTTASSSSSPGWKSWTKRPPGTPSRDPDAGGSAEPRQGRREQASERTRWCVSEPAQRRTQPQAGPAAGR